jgi:ketol-acid reductoisomerase
MFPVLVGDLADVRSGKFARDWMAEHRAGAPNLQRMRKAAEKHPVEEAGRAVRALLGK